MRGIGLVHTLRTWARIVVTQNTPARLCWCAIWASSQYGHQVREGILGKDNNPDTIEGIVTLLKYENPSRVLEGVHAKVDELRNQQLAPQDVRIVPYIDRDDLVHATVGKVSTPSSKAWAWSCIVLILFLGSPRQCHRGGRHHSRCRWSRCSS